MRRVPVADVPRVNRPYSGTVAWAMKFVLVHSPVVGPSTWRWVAKVLRSEGHEVVVPNLVAAAMAGDPDVFAQAAADAADSDEETVIIGHSGAGAVMPLL